MNLRAFCIGATLALGLAACKPEVTGITGGTVTTPDNSASLTLPAGTFATPVAVGLNKITIPSPDPEQYTPLVGGGFQLTASSSFSATQDAILEVQDSALLTASGAKLTPQAVPADSIVVGLAKRPQDSSFTMLPAMPMANKWQVSVWKEYLCLECKINIAIFQPARIEINAPDTISEGSSLVPTVSYIGGLGGVSYSYYKATFTSSDPNVLGVANNPIGTALISGLRVGTSTLSTQKGLLIGSKQISVVANAPVLFSANYNAGTINGYSRGQVASSGSPTPIVTITLPAGSKPNDLAFDNSGNLWVTDNTGNRLLRLTPSQLLNTGSPTPGVIITGLSQPVGLNFASNGDLWVSNSSNVVRYLAADLGVSGAPAPNRTLNGQMAFPGAVAVDANNNLWVAMYSGAKVVRWTPNEQNSNPTAPSFILSSGLVQPAGLEFDASGNLYVGQQGAPSGISVFETAQLSSPTPPAAAARFIGNGATNKVFSLTRDASTGTLWANNQGNGEVIAYTTAQLAQTSPAATTPSLVIGGATQVGNGFGGVAFASGGAAPAPLPTINSFSASPNSLGAGGGNVTLSWSVTGATSLSIDQGVGTVTGSSISRNVSSTTTFILTATNANGSTPSNPVTVTVNVPGKKLWHASFRDNLIRGYSESKWGGGNPAAAPDNTLNLAACGGDIKPNDLIQDSAGNIIFTSPVQGRVVRIAASVVARGSTVNLMAAECQSIFSLPSGGIGLALDTDGRSFFVGTDNGVRFLRYIVGTDSYNNQALPILNANNKISGLHLAVNRLYAVDYINFGSTPGTVRVYDLDPNRILDASLRLTFRPTSGNFHVPEGISIAAGRLWVANNGRTDAGNSDDNLMGFALSDINATAVGANTTLAPKILTRGANDSFMHCPGGLATAPNGELWVNVQGANSADCSNGANLGNIYKYTTAQLNGAATTPAPALQFSGIVSIPGYGGLFFGK